MNVDKTIRKIFSIKKGNVLSAYSTTRGNFTWITKSLIADGSRETLAQLFAALGYTKGAEIGVEYGKYSEILFKNIPGLELLCIDPWEAYPKVSVKRAEAIYQSCKKRLSQYNAKIMRMSSEEGAKLVPDGSLDFVYIDASHGYIPVKEDNEWWVPKVRVGGIVSGHDYTNHGNDEKTLTRCGVVQAVDEYVEKMGIEIYYATTDYPASWFWGKTE